VFAEHHSFIIIPPLPDVVDLLAGAVHMHT
jgi:hypothetical protein